MKKPKDIQTAIDDTLNVLDTFEDVNVSPFFKDKTLQRLFAEKEETVATGFRWFTPKIQLATLVCVLLINIFGIYQLTQTEYDQNITEFATMYDLGEESRSSLFN
jgi:cytochrome c-type biogenesis protein CcmH/NrfG